MQAVHLAGPSRKGASNRKKGCSCGCASDCWGPLGEGAGHVSELSHLRARTLGYWCSNSHQSLAEGLSWGCHLPAFLCPAPRRNTPSGPGPQVLQQEVLLNVVSLNVVPTASIPPSVPRGLPSLRHFLCHLPVQSPVNVALGRAISFLGLQLLSCLPLPTNSV